MKKNQSMNQEKIYVSPLVELIEVSVESGFATSSWGENADNENI